MDGERGGLRCAVNVHINCSLACAYLTAQGGCKQPPPPQLRGNYDVIIFILSF